MTLLLSVYAVLAVMMFLGVIVVIVRDVNLSFPIVEAALLFVAVFWLSASLATDYEELLGKTALYVFMFGVLLWFIAYRSIASFWATMFALTYVVIREHAVPGDQPLYTRATQCIGVLVLTAFLLRYATGLLLPSLEAELAAQFTTLVQFIRLSEILTISLLGVLIFATFVSTVHRLRELKWLELKWAPSHPPLLALRDAVYYSLNGLRFFGLAFAIITEEAIAYLFNTFLSRRLVTVILYISATAAIISWLVAEAFMVHPYLTILLRNRHPFFSIPPNELMSAYGIMMGAFFVVVVSVAALVWIWLPRKATREDRQPAWRRFTLTAVVVALCVWLAGATALIANNLLSIDSLNFSTPGYFTALAPVLAAIVIKTLQVGVQKNRRADHYDVHYVMTLRLVDMSTRSRVGRCA